MELNFYIQEPGNPAKKLKPFVSAVDLDKFISENISSLQKSLIIFVNASTGKQIGCISVKRYFELKSKHEI